MYVCVNDMSGLLSLWHRTCGWLICWTQFVFLFSCVSHALTHDLDVTSIPLRRSIFDIDNIDIGPERRSYLETRLERVWERNSEVKEKMLQTNSL